MRSLRLKITVGVFFAVLCGLMSISYLYGRSLRHAGIVEGRSLLKHGWLEYQRTGVIPSFGTDVRMFALTNAVSIDGTNHHCVLAVEVYKFYGHGALAMTTNQVYVWLDKKSGPKVIGREYRPPIFPAKF